MPTRPVEVQYRLNDLVGDETYELWLKHEDDEWELFQSGLVGPGPTQNFTLPELEDSHSYVLQARMRREGRYRVGYLTPDPDGWPAQSRLEFTVPGEAPPPEDPVEFDTVDLDNTGNILNGSYTLAMGSGTPDHVHMAIGRSSEANIEDYEYLLSADVLDFDANFNWGWNLNPSGPLTKTAYIRFVAHDEDHNELAVSDEATNSWQADPDS